MEKTGTSAITKNPVEAPDKWLVNKDRDESSLVKTVSTKLGAIQKEGRGDRRKANGSTLPGHMAPLSDCHFPERCAWCGARMQELFGCMCPRNPFASSTAGGRTGAGVLGEETTNLRALFPVSEGCQHLAY